MHKKKQEQSHWHCCFCTLQPEIRTVYHSHFLPKEERKTDGIQEIEKGFTEKGVTVLKHFFMAVTMTVNLPLRTRVSGSGQQRATDYPADIIEDLPDNELK